MAHCIAIVFGLSIR